jgi:predicted NAD/FAD-dependent oxidoreductase
VLAVLDRDPQLPSPGGVQFASGPVRWLADNGRKHVSDEPAITLHASGGWSAAWYEASDDVVGATLHAWLAPWLGAATVRSWQIKRWYYAQPRDLVAAPALTVDVDGALMAFAGDAFDRARIEGAARSGLAAASELGRARA